MDKFSIQTYPGLLAPPDADHILGVAFGGQDVFSQTLDAVVVAIFTVLPIWVILFLGGALVGASIARIQNGWGRGICIGAINYWITLPTLLIAVMLLIHFGASWLAEVVVVSFAFIPTQALFVFNRMVASQSEPYVLAKTAIGFPRGYVLRHHILPIVVRDYGTYSLSRGSEILMADLALNFLGLGAGVNVPTLGRLLFDGIQFLQIAWWVWLPPAACAATLIIFFNGLVNLHTIVVTLREWGIVRRAQS